MQSLAMNEKMEMYKRLTLNADKQICEAIYKQNHFTEINKK